MTKLPRAIVALIPLAAVLVACAPNADAPPVTTAPPPTPSLDVPTPSPTAEGLPERDDVRVWAELALPENSAGGQGWVSRGAGSVDADGGSVDISQPGGLFEVVITCQSEDGSPLTLLADTAAFVGESITLNCSRPGAAQDTTAKIAYEADPAARLRVSATADAVYAYEVREHLESAN